MKFILHIPRMLNLEQKNTETRKTLHIILTTKTDINSTLNKKGSYQHLLKTMVSVSRHFPLLELINSFHKTA